MGHLGSTVARLKLKGIGGGAHKGWRLRFNSIQREERLNVDNNVERCVEIERQYLLPSPLEEFQEIQVERMNVQPLNLTSGDSSMKVRLKVLPDTLRGGAWPSSVRAVRCRLKCRNEQDPRPMLLPYVFVRVLIGDRC
jgi:hypothetical protein